MVTNTKVAGLNWCFSTLGCPGLNFWDTLSLAFSYKFSLVELRTLEGRVDLPRYFSEVFGSPGRLARAMEGASVRIASLDTSARLLSCPEGAKRELLDFAQWADALRVPYLRVFDGGRTELLDEAQLEEMVSFLAWWRRERAQAGWQVDLMVETHDSLCVLENVWRLQGALRDEPVRLLWDSHHTWRKTGACPVDTWKSLQDSVVHIHFKDSSDEPGEKLPFTYVGLGEGEFPLRQLFDVLMEDGYEGPVSLEWERQWHERLGPLETQLAKIAGTFIR